jgi:hypothetical protein
MPWADRRATTQEANGFQEVFQTFPDQFRRNFKGKGHEVKDLETLLLMYYDWSKRVIPGGMTFDTFVNQMEGMGGTASVKVRGIRQAACRHCLTVIAPQAELRELRQGIYSMVEEAVAAAQPTGAHDGAPPAAADLPAPSPKGAHHCWSNNSCLPVQPLPFTPPTPAVAQRYCTASCAALQPAQLATALLQACDQLQCVNSAAALWWLLADQRSLHAWQAPAAGAA